jgi:hypothetical protein
MKASQLIHAQGNRSELALAVRFRATIADFCPDDGSTESDELAANRPVSSSPQGVVGNFHPAAMYARIGVNLCT